MITKSKNLLSDLEKIVNASIDPSMFPYKKGNSIRIGKYAIRTTKYGHKVFDCELNCMIAETFSKTAAVALAKYTSQHEEDRSAHECILRIDRKVEKWYNDCMFYRNTIQKTDDPIKADVAATRYDIAKTETEHARSQLDKYIYS